MRETRSQCDRGRAAACDERGRMRRDALSQLDVHQALCFMLLVQADEQAPVRPGQAARDERGRVCLDDLADADLDYGTDRAGLAALRRRLHSAITAYNGAQPALLRL